MWLPDARSYMNYEGVRKRMIARILAVNDTCADEKFRLAMRAVVMAAVNEGIDAVANHATDEGYRSYKGQFTSR